MQKKIFPALTGFRAIAAWIIFIYHFFPFKNVNNKYPFFIQRIVSEFHIGVDMFFVLSGFLITYRYFNNSTINFKKYMVNRFARIYPMYFIITILVFLVGYIRFPEWDSIKLLEFLVSISMTKALFSEFFLSGIPQGWTITVEEIFYFFAPIFFLLIKRYKIFLCILPFIIFFIFDFIKSQMYVETNVYGFLQTNIHNYAGEFFVGIFAGILVLNNKIIKKNYYTYFGILFIIFYILFRKYIMVELFKLDNQFSKFLELIVFSLFGIAPLIIGLIYEDTLVKKVLSSKIMVILGKSSYIFYLIHKGFIPIFIDENITDNKFYIFFILNIISVLLYYSLEHPLNKYIRLKYKKIVSN